MVSNALKKLGLKSTPQRIAILKLLEGNTSHPSAEQIYRQLKAQYPSLSLATVYNTLDALVRCGKLQEIRIETGRRRFDPDLRPHGHFLCRACRSVFDFDLTPADIRTPFDVGGFLVEEYSPCFFGVCPACRGPGVVPGEADGTRPAPRGRSENTEGGDSSLAPVRDTGDRGKL